MAAAGPPEAEAALRRDCSRALKIPFLPTDAPAAPQPPSLLLPLYDYQLRSLARMQAIEAYTQGARPLACTAIRTLRACSLSPSPSPRCAEQTVVTPFIWKYMFLLYLPNYNLQRAGRPPH